MGWLSRLKKKILPIAPAPKVVIGFKTSGCMAHIHTFDFIGFVVKEWKKDTVDFYEVWVMKQGNGPEDMRDHPTEVRTAWQIQKLMFNIYLFVD